MKALYYFLISFLTTVLAFSSVTYTSCKKDSCKDVSCMNGGSCMNGVCTCPTQYSGTRCENELCKEIDCLNGGMCVSGTCKCVNGYEGKRCEIVNKFIGGYEARDVCNGASSAKLYTVSITMKPTGEATLKIMGVAPNNSALYAPLTIDGNSFAFGSSTYEGYIYSGSGVFRNDTIEVGYSVDAGTSSYTCSGIWVKK